MNLGIAPHKYFSKDILVFEDKLTNKEIFTFSKFADGEWAIITGESINNGEFLYDNRNELFIKARNELVNAFQYSNPNYYIGISCPCCQGIDVHNFMKIVSGRHEKFVTWANLWVNSNYSYFLERIMPIFNSYEVVLVANEESKISKLPFEVSKFFPVKNNAWVDSREQIDAIKNYLGKDKLKGKLILLCCGPFGNILAHQLTEHNKHNTYLDIGSTLNEYMQSYGFRRTYLTKYKDMKEPCIWGDPQ